MDKNTRIGQAVSWSALDVLVHSGLNFVVFIVLARILIPDDFGLVAMLTIFVAVSSLLVDSGFGQALIQRQETTPTDESTIFFFTIGMGVLIAVILCALAPWIANFYDQPLLEPMAWWMALNVLLNTFSSIHITLLIKKLDFKTITKSGVVAGLASAMVSITMAIQNYGVWALVGRALATTVTTTVMLWCLHSWRPQWLFSLTSLRSLFKFGGFVLWTGLLYTLHRNLYALLVGKMHSAQDVGFYSQAQRLQEFPSNTMNRIVGRVAFPVFSAAATDKAKLARGMRKTLVSVMFINIPFMLGLMVLAEPLVSALLGEKWLPSVPVLQALSLVGLMWPLSALNVNVLKAQGRSGLNARIQLIKLSLAISLLLIASPYGILTIAYGQVLASALAFWVNAHYTNVFLGYGGVGQLRDVAPYFAASFPMVVSIALVMWVLTAPSYIELVAAVPIGASVYILVCRVAKLDGLDNLVHTLRRS